MNKFIALIFSFGLGYDVISEDKLKGIIQIETTYKSISFGFLHLSSLSNGFDQDKEDQNIIYIKKSIDLK